MYFRVWSAIVQFVEAGREWPRVVSMGAIDGDEEAPGDDLSSTTAVDVGVLPAFLLNANRDLGASDVRSS